MRRSKRSREEDYIEENEELDETEDLEEYDEGDYDGNDYGEEGYDESDEEFDENGEPIKKSGKGKKVLTVSIILVALVALFFASSKLTGLWLDYNQEPSSYQSDAPDLDDDKSLTDGEASFPLNKNGGGYQSYMYDQLGAGLYPLGVRYDDSEGKVVATVEQDDMKQILKTFHEWYNEGIINSDAATRPEDANYQACSIAQGWSGAAITSWGPQLGVECVAQKWGPTIVSNETVRGSLNCISANCAYPEKALQFLQLVNTDTYVRDLFYYGVQGDNWDYTDDSKTFVHKNNADWSMAGYTQGSFFAITPTDDFDFNQFDEVKELNEKAEPSVLLGFTLDTTPIADELANCIQIAERYKGELLTGTADPEVMVPQMMQELRAAGFDKIVAEAQSQVDAFMATNK